MPTFIAQTTVATGFLRTIPIASQFWCRDVSNRMRDCGDGAELQADELPIDAIRALTALATQVSELVKF